MDDLEVQTDFRKPPFMYQWIGTCREKDRFSENRLNRLGYSTLNVGIELDTTEYMDDSLDDISEIQ